MGKYLPDPSPDDPGQQPRGGNRGAGDVTVV